ncbi:MAG: tryptophan--tRNA ligase [Gammaproteobacteria bacterium]
MNSTEFERRVVSGMRPTGRMHIGHLHGALKNWVQLQHEYECYFFVADWHALTTHYADSYAIEQNTWEMLIDWLSVGINPGAATIFIQSKVPEHAELHLLLSMITPLGWLERVPSYKDQQQNLTNADLSTYGFLGYPLLQASDILIYRAGNVPVGADQVAHVEMTREVARRFNYLYGREPGFEEQAQMAIRKMGRRAARLYRDLVKSYQEQGEEEALAKARALVDEQQNLAIGDKERLLGFIEGGGKQILPEPQALLTNAPEVPGVDGRKMSKSYGNAIALREAPDVVEKQIRTMQTDPARKRRHDPGDPDSCPVFALHQIYSSDETLAWAADGCRKASIGCLDCKSPLCDAVQAELEPIRERAQQFEENPDLVKSMIAEGTEAAREEARETLDTVRSAIGISYR